MEPRLSAECTKVPDETISNNVSDMPRRSEGTYSQDSWVQGTQGASIEAATHPVCEICKGGSAVGERIPLTTTTTTLILEHCSTVLEHDFLGHLPVFL